MTMNEMDTIFLLARSDLGANWYQMKDSWLWDSEVELNKCHLWQGNLTRNEIQAHLDHRQAHRTLDSRALKHQKLGTLLFD